jgi:hypothetical protein
MMVLHINANYKGIFHVFYLGYTDFIFEHAKRFYQFASGILWQDYLIYKTTLRGSIRIRKQISIFFLSKSFAS